MADRLRAVGCVYAEAEAAAIGEAGVDPDEAVRLRAQGVPLEHVVGHADFAGVRVALGPGVFVPRARAELLVAVAVDVADGVVVDLGCGAGPIASAIKHRRPRADVHGAELDPIAAGWARVNGAAFGFAVHEGSWWDALPPPLLGAVDLAVAYLPHVPTDRLDDIHPDFRAHEPLLAVDGGADGLDPLRAVVADSERWLAPAGRLLVLVAEEQVARARRIAPFGVLREDDGDVVLGLGIAVGC